MAGIIDEFQDVLNINDDGEAIALLRSKIQFHSNIPFCEALWEVTSANDSVSPRNLKTALELIFAREQKSYEAFVSLLTDFQFKCRSALAREGGKSVYSMNFVKAVGPHSTASVNRAITRMININILFKSGKEVRFVNPFFKAWLLPRGR
ncbi:MAG: hypothetical protein PVG08_09460 [Desulfobacterales bacterium]|jgi:hypothetical protein